MTVAAANAAYETARAAYERAAVDLRAALDAEVAALTGGLPIRLLEVARAVACQFEVELADLLGRSRRREHVEARFAALAFSHEACPFYSQEQLAGYYGRHHNMVPHSVEMFRHLSAKDRSYHARVSAIRAVLGLPPPRPSA